MYLFLDFDGFWRCESQIEEQLRVAGALNESLRRLYYAYEFVFDERAADVRAIMKRASKLEEAIQKRRGELRLAVEELAGTYDSLNEMVLDAREAAARASETIQENR